MSARHPEGATPAPHIWQQPERDPWSRDVPTEAPALDPAGRSLFAMDDLRSEFEPGTLQGDVYRACYRLLGDHDLSAASTYDAMRRAIDRVSLKADPFQAMVAALAICVDADRTHGELLGVVTFAQHRARLRRDLRRRPEVERAVLAMHFLVAVPSVIVARRLGLPEQRVREIALAWRLLDDGGADNLLSEIDAWISEPSDPSGEADLHHLDHLDEPAGG
ncbi:MAG: hypothetical protein R2698_11190 [Microthrixaceae bacterium]